MVYVISDIHGRKDRFDDIMEQIALTEQDTLYVLGDVIDRNPDGITLLRYIMQQPNVKMLLGNHEYMMLNALGSQEHIRVWYRNGGDITHKLWKKQRLSARESILQYLYALPLTVELNVDGKRYRLVHGYSPDENTLASTDLQALTHDIVWKRVQSTDQGPQDRTVIFGHTPTFYYQDCKPIQIWYGRHLIGIDCGAAYAQGRLACLRLDDLKEFYSRC